VEILANLDNSIITIYISSYFFIARVFDGNHVLVIIILIPSGVACVAQYFKPVPLIMGTYPPIILIYTYTAMLYAFVFMPK